jgi:Rieske 2Fe-2S family protein
MSCLTPAGLVITGQQPLEPKLADDMTALFAGLGLSGCVTVAEDVFIARSNWKLWTENFLECWHCTPNHPELAATESHVRLFEAEDYQTYAADCAAARRRAEQAGFTLPDDRELDPADPVFAFWEVAPLGGGRSSPSPNGQRLGPALASEAMDGLFVYGAVGPFLHFSIAVDHAVIFSFLPINSEETEVRTVWLAREAMDSDAATWLWKRTLAQDRSLTEALHQSVKSRHYRGGQYLSHEQRAARFTKWATKS